MENVAEALKMAGSVLLFIIGLSLAILTFTNIRETSDKVLSYADREFLTIQGDERFYYLSNKDDTNRYVGIETIIPALYRIEKEKYKIVFEFADNYYLYEDREGNQVTEMNPENMQDPKEYVNAILYRQFEDGETELEFKRKYGINSLGNKSLYDYLKENQNKYNIKESLGVYIQEELDTNTDSYGNQDDDIDEVPDSNKFERRIITYTFVSK